MYKRHCEYWYRIEGLKNSKWTLRKPSSELHCRVTRLKRWEARIATGLITGRCGLRKHLWTMAIYVGDSSCRLCSGDDERLAHIIYSCEALAAFPFWGIALYLKRQPGEKHQPRSYQSLLNEQDFLTEHYREIVQYTLKHRCFWLSISTPLP